MGRNPVVKCADRDHALVLQTAQVGCLVVNGCSNSGHKRYILVVLGSKKSPILDKAEVYPDKPFSWAYYLDLQSQSNTSSSKQHSTLYSHKVKKIHETLFVAIQEHNTQFSQNNSAVHTA